jgi:hypothetical protein
MKVLDTKNTVMHGVHGFYFQQAHLLYYPTFMQYYPGKKCNPLVDTHVSIFMHQVNVEKASRGCQNPVEHPHIIYRQKMKVLDT